MSTARRRFRKGRRSRRPIRRRRITTWGAMSHLARKAMSGVRYLKNLINVEFKTIDKSYNTTYNNSWSLNLLNGLSKGDDYNSRDGRQIRVKSVQLKWNPTADPEATTDTLLRFIVFIWRSPDGTAPTIDDVLEPGSTAMTRVRSLADRKNTIILYDRVVTLSPDSYSTKFLQYYRRLDMKTVFNSGDTGSISDIDTGALYCAIVSSDNVTPPNVAWSSRVRFIDN